MAAVHRLNRLPDKDSSENMQESAAVILVDVPGKVQESGGNDNLDDSPSGKPPLWMPLAGRITLARTIDVFESSPLIENIILVLDPRHVADADMLRQREGWHKITAIVAGDASRQASVCRGLDVLEEMAPGSRWVIIHDAARPLVPSTLLVASLQAVQEHQAATAAVPVRETIKQVQQGQITATFDRSQLWTIQTPQAFSYPLLHQAHRQARAQHLQDSIDDAALLEQMGQRVVIFPGSYTNIKIITAEDLLLAEALLQGSV